MNFCPHIYRISGMKGGNIMRFDRLTKALQHAFSDAQSLTISHNHTAIESVHLLLSMLDAPEASIKPLLQQSRGDVNLLSNALQKS